jgi:hypothetical protein
MRNTLMLLVLGVVLANAGCQACGPKVVSQPPPGALILSPQTAPAPVFFPPAQQQILPSYAQPLPAPAASIAPNQQLPYPRPTGSTGFAPANPEQAGTVTTPPYVPQRNT